MIRPAALALLALVVPAWLPIGAAQAVTGDQGKLVLVLDSSGSMNQPAGDGTTKIAAARTALTRVVGRLPDAAPVGLRVYGATVFKKGQAGACTDTQLTVPIATGNRPQLLSAIAAYKPYGETPIAYALQQAAKDLGASGQRTILLVSDGEATCAPEPCEVAEEIAEQGIDVKIDVVGFRVAGKARSQLQCVAREGRGDYYDADSTVDLEAGLDRLSTRAFRPFRISGTPVQGTAVPEGAPAVAPGHYSDEFDLLDKPKHYLVNRTIPGSTVRAGLSFRRPPGATSLVIQTRITLMTPGAGTCESGRPRVQEGDQGFATGAASSWPNLERQDDECFTADQLVLVVDPGKDFREIANVPFELRVDEEPPAAETKTLPAKADNPVWVPMPAGAARHIVPGSSFPDAPLLKPGSYRTTLMPGEVQLYKIKADWGQRIQAQITVPPVGGAAREHLGIRYVDTAVISPVRAEAYAVSPVKAPGGPGGKRGVLTASRGVTQAITTKEIRYLNRDGATSEDTGTSTPGEYYLVVSMTRKADDPGFTIPMTLTVGVQGVAGTGRPTYVSGPAPTTGTPSATPTDESSTVEPSPTTGERTEAGGPVQGEETTADDEFPVGLVAGLGGGALVLVMAGGLAVLLLRRRT